MNSDKPATQAEIAVIDFQPIEPWHSKSAEERVKRMREINSDVYTLSVIAAQIVSFERDELIQKVRDEYDTFGPMLMKICEGGETLKGLTELMTAAETRLAVAMANVEPDPVARPRRPSKGKPKLFVRCTRGGLARVRPYLLGTSWPKERRCQPDLHSTHGRSVNSLKAKDGAK